jgi:uncharacterized membrane protein YgcG
MNPLKPQLFVRLPSSGRLQPVVYARSAVIHEVVTRALSLGGEEADEALLPRASFPFVVTHGGRALRVSDTLCESGVGKGEILSLTGRLKGGMMAMRIAYMRSRAAQQKRVGDDEKHQNTLVAAISEMMEREVERGKSLRETPEERDVRENPTFERAPPLRIDFEVEGAGGEYTLGGALRPRRWLYYYLCAGWAVHAWVTSTKWFAALVLASILTVGVTTGLLLDGVLDPHAPVARGVGTATLAVFTLEVSLKVLACGPRPAYFVTAPRGEGSMNAFDFLLVAASFALLAFDSESTRQSLLLVRLMRLMTIVDFVPELKVIVAGLATGLKSVGYIVALLLLIIYLFGIMAVQFFGSNDPANFGTVPVAMMTLFQTACLTSWSPIAYVQWHGCDSYLNGNYVLPDGSPIGGSPSSSSSSSSSASPSPSSTEGGGDASGGRAQTTVSTLTGPLPLWVCSDPRARPVFTLIFFTSFTILTASESCALVLH